MVDYKQEAIKQWTETPAGFRSSRYPVGTREFFEDIERDRYEVYAPWMKKTLQFERYGGKKLLEIGVGLGTDHLQFAKAGAILTGIDIAPRSIEMTKTRFEIYGFHSNLMVADAENLPFADNVFDVVFSFGVLHHVPDIKKAMFEIWRVLKPGGELILGVYHRNSLLLLLFILRHMIVKRGFFNTSWEQRLADMEEEGGEAVPLVRVYTPSQIRKLLSSFSSIDISIRHFQFGKTFLGRLMNTIFSLPLTKQLGRWLGHRWGWYIIVRAKK